MKKFTFIFGLSVFLGLIYSSSRAGIETIGDIKTTTTIIQQGGGYTNEVLAAGANITMTRANGTNTISSSGSSTPGMLCFTNAAAYVSGNKLYYYSAAATNTHEGVYWNSFNDSSNGCGFTNLVANAKYSGVLTVGIIQNGYDCRHGVTRNPTADDKNAAITVIPFPRLVAMGYDMSLANSALIVPIPFKMVLQSNDVIFCQGDTDGIGEMIPAYCSFYIQKD